MSLNSYGTYRSDTHTPFSDDDNCPLGPPHRRADRNSARARQSGSEPVARVAAADPGSRRGLHTVSSSNSLRCRLLHLLERLQKKSTADFSPRIRSRPVYNHTCSGGRTSFGFGYIMASSVSPRSYRLTARRLGGYGHHQETRSAAAAGDRHRGRESRE